MNIFEHIYRSCRQIHYDNASANSLIEHVIICWKDPECLREMANPNKIKCDLPVNIWIDTNQSYKKSGHWKRIKFQKDRSNRVNYNNLASMTFDGTPIENTMAGCALTAKEIKQVSNFVINNKFLLDLVSDGKIYTQDFFDLMIIGGEIASDSEKENQKKEIDFLLKNL